MSEEQTQIAVPVVWNITPAEVNYATGKVVQHFPELTAPEKGALVMLRLVHLAYSKRTVTLARVEKAINATREGVDQSKLNDQQRIVLQGHWLTLPNDPNQTALVE